MRTGISGCLLRNVSAALTPAGPLPMAMNPGAATFPGYHVARRATCLVRVLSYLLIGDSPHETEGVTGRVAVHAKEVVLVGVGHPGRAECENLTLGAVDVVDGDVEVELLRTVRIGKPRRIVLRGELKREPAPARIRQHCPGVVLFVDAAAQHACVEGGQLSGIPAVDDGGSKLSDHGRRVAVMAPLQTRAANPRSSVLRFSIPRPASPIR